MCSPSPGLADLVGLPHRGRKRSQRVCRTLTNSFIFIREKTQMVNDTISDMLTRIRNASLIKNRAVSVPLTRLSQRICQILEAEGFIESFQRASNRELVVSLKYRGPESKPCITNLRRISKPGLRIYTNHKDIPKILGGMGVIIISTSRGVMTDREARFYGVGGEVLCSVW